MRFLFYFLISTCYLFSFDLVLNSGSENNEPFTIMHISNEKEFTCKEFSKDDKNYFICELPGKVQLDLKNRTFHYFKLKFEKKDNKVFLYILPNVSAKMYNFSQEIYKDKIMKPSDSTKSRSFTFIFSNEGFFSKNYDGLDFNVEFQHETLPSVGALDLNSNPVIIPQSADINTYLRIKQEYDKQNYDQVITDAKNAINRYKGSIFMSEFILYKLRAQTKLYTYAINTKDQKILEQMIQEAKSWSRTFTSDRNYPEVLYIMLRTYIALNQNPSVDYVLEILKNEYPNNYFTELSLLDYADYIYSLGEKDKANIIYDQIYYKTKNLNLASRAAITLAIDMINLNPKLSSDYANIVLKADPNYFYKDLPRTIKLANLLYNKGMFKLSAMIFENAFSKMSKIDDDYEDILKGLALAYAKTDNVNKAQKYLNLYNSEFPDGQYSFLIKENLDNVFFELKDNNATFLHQRYKQLMKDYDDDIYKKALNADIMLYFKEGNYSAVISYKDKIEQENNATIVDLLKKSATMMLTQDIQNDDCIKAVNTYRTFLQYNIAQNIDYKKKMLACFRRTSNLEDAINYAKKNYNLDEIYYGLQLAQMQLENSNYKDAIFYSEKVANSKIIKSQQEDFDAYFVEFMAYLGENDYNKAINILNILQTYPMNFKMVEVYNALVSYSNDRNMITNILTFAPKAIDYQNLKGVNVFSPNLEFIYVDSLAKQGQNQKILSVLRDVLKLNLNPNDRARALYLQSVAYEKLKDINYQKQSLKECLDIKQSSKWQGLCKEKMNILGN